jgi:endoglucanase
MNDNARRFLSELLKTCSPAGFEEPAARCWREEASAFADEVTVDVNGNSFARLAGDGPRVVFEGHIDELTERCADYLDRRPAEIAPGGGR